MNRRDDNQFRLKPAAPKGNRSRRGERFTTRVLRGINRVGGMPLRRTSTKPRSTLARLGRGAGAAPFAGAKLDPYSRRVVIKSRIVNLKQVPPERSTPTRSRSRGRESDTTASRRNPPDRERMRPAGMNSPRRVVRIATSFASSGFAQRDGERLKVPANLLTVLRQRDLDGVSRALAAETGLSYRPLEDGERITGVYRRMVVAASGRFAMLDDGLGFSLVPWRPVLEQRIGQQLGATLRGDHVIWSFGRQRGLSRWSDQLMDQPVWSV